MLKLLLTATTAAALALPAAAGASTASIEGGTVVWRGDASAETVYFYVPYDDQGDVRITGAGVEPGAGCTPYFEPSNGERGALCPNLAAWRLDAGAGDDKLVTLSNPTPESKADAVQADLGPGNDVFETSLSVATVHGGDGDDRLESSVYTGTQNYDDRFFGDAGDDELLGGYGADELRGGPGDDVLLGDGRSISRRPDMLDGGAGRDKLADYVPIAPYTGKAASVSLDELANDGFPGEGDDVRAVEIVHSYAALDFLGSDAPEEALFAYQNENIDPTGPSTLRGRGGDDALTGTLRADTLDGGAGRDVLDGAAGDDTLAARDGEIDTLRCGAGTDKAVVDAEDQVAADCETVERPAPPAPPAPAPPAPTPPAPAPVPVTPITVPGPAPAPVGPVQQAGTDAPAAPKVLGAPRLKAALSSGLKLRVAGRPGARVAVRALRGRQALAAGSGTVAASGTATITLRFSAKGRSVLRRARSVTLSLLVEGGGTAKVTLKR